MTAQRAVDLVFAEGLPIGTPEERDLAQAFKRGERDAYDSIHERYEARVYSVCKRMLGNPDDAQEAAQEAFIRIYQGLPRFNGRYRLGAWIVRITTNVCLDHLRSRSRRPSDPTPLEILDLESPPAESNDPELLFLRNVEGRRVRKVLASLPPLHRAAIVLRDFEGVSYAEIAETLGITECQVKALLHRARRSFRRHWSTGAASVFLPFRLITRLFESKPPASPAGAGEEKIGERLTVVSQAAESAMTTGQHAVAATQNMVAAAGHASAACAGIIQQCSAFVAEKAAPVVAAVVVGTATVGVAVTAGRNHEPAERQTMATASAAPAPDSRPTARAAATPDKLAATTKAKVKSASTEGGSSALPGTDTPGEAPVTPPSPSDPPEGSSPPPVVDEGGITPEPNPQPTPAVPPEPGTFEFGFNIAGAGLSPCDCLAETTVVGRRVGISGKNVASFDHVVTGTAYAAGVPTYGLEVLQHSGMGRDHAMDFQLRTDVGAFMYRATGWASQRQQTEWGGLKYIYTGRYSIYSMPEKNLAMPQSGTYTAEVVVSWRQARIVATNVTIN